MRLSPWFLVPALGAFGLLVRRRRRVEPPEDRQTVRERGRRAACTTRCSPTSRPCIRARVDLQKAAPPTARGWDADATPTRSTAMKDAWLAARAAYEHARAPSRRCFPTSTPPSTRATTTSSPSSGRGRPGPLRRPRRHRHARHRAHPVCAGHSGRRRDARVHAARATRRQPSRRPSDEAAEFKTKLCERLVSDTHELQNDWTPQSIDLGGAFRGLIALMNEQREKVNKAASEEEESRYAQRTMADIRDNLAGTIKAYALFQPWLARRKTAPRSTPTCLRLRRARQRLRGGFGRRHSPAARDWSAEKPSDKDLGTPFGKLYLAVQSGVDPNARARRSTA